MAAEPTLARAFLDRLGEAAGAEVLLTELLHTLWDTGRSAWPEITIAPVTWAGQLGQAAAAAEPGTQAGFVAALPSLHAEDFYLACGCALALPPALSAFDRSYLGQLPVLLGHLRPAPGFLDEVIQVVRERLLVSRADGPARIASYAGQGPLLGWLRVVATRTALNLRDSQAEKHPRDSAAVEGLVSAHNPERELIVGQQRQELLVILREAVCTLPAPHRQALRMHLSERLTGDEIAAKLSINRATVVRWLSAARQALLAETERLFRRRLNLSAGEVESLVAETRSQIDVSLSELLKTVPPERGAP